MSGALLPVFDAHVDSLQRALDLGDDLGTRTAGHLDLVRGVQGGLATVVLVSWCEPVHMEPGREGARRRTERLVGAFHALLRAHPEQVEAARSGADLDAIHGRGRVAAVAGIEGGHSLEESLEALEAFFAAGVRVLTLVWNNHLPWIRSCQAGAGPGIPAGLSPFGRTVVRRMNELGVLVDLSHAGERSFFDALEASAAPVIASHSACRTLHDHPRNLTDDQLRELARAGGVVGIVFCTPFLDARARALEEAARDTDAYRSLAAAHPSELFVRQGDWLQAEVAPLPLERVADHVLHAMDVAGPEHVGLGSDFDGIQRRPAGLEDASCYQALADVLRRRGVAEAELAALFHGNLARVFRAATGPGTRAAREPLSIRWA